MNIPVWLHELKNWLTLPSKTFIGYEVAKNKAYPRLIRIADVAIILQTEIHKHLSKEERKKILLVLCQLDRALWGEGVGDPDGGWTDLSSAGLAGKPPDPSGWNKKT